MRTADQVVALAGNLARGRHALSPKRRAQLVADIRKSVAIARPGSITDRIAREFGIAPDPRRVQPPRSCAYKCGQPLTPAAEAALMLKEAGDSRVAIARVERRLEGDRYALETNGHPSIVRWARGGASIATDKLKASIAHDEAVLAHLRGHR